MTCHDQKRQRMINFYREMWEKRAHHLTPINALTKNKKKGPITWTLEVQKLFEDIKKIVAEDAILHCPDFNQAFEIHTDVVPVKNKNTDDVDISKNIQ